jgi:predicted transcriptional regulator
MDLPYHLKTLPPDALDVIRYFGTIDNATASVDDICDNVGLSERGFGKVIRRLVTKGYVVMDGNQIYRLTEQGHDAVEELTAYDKTAPARSQTSSDGGERTQRHMILVVPRRFVAEERAQVFLGFDADPSADQTVELVARLSVLHGEPAAPQEASFQLDSKAVYESFWITPGRFTRTRIRVQVYQLGPNPDDISVSGGMYVDVAVTANADEGGSQRVAYGADITVERQE